MPDTSKRTVHVYVFDGLADWEVGLAIAYLNTPAFQPPTPRYCVATVGTQNGVRRIHGWYTNGPG